MQIGLSALFTPKSSRLFRSGSRTGMGQGEGARCDDQRFPNPATRPHRTSATLSTLKTPHSEMNTERTQTELHDAH